MESNGILRLANFKATITLLKGRERSLKHIAQSGRCANRPAAELELGRVRVQIERTYAQMRPLGEHV